MKLNGSLRDPRFRHRPGRRLYKEELWLALSDRRKIVTTDSGSRWCSCPLPGSSCSVRSASGSQPRRPRETAQVHLPCVSDIEEAANRVDRGSVSKCETIFTMWIEGTLCRFGRRHHEVAAAGPAGGTFHLRFVRHVTRIPTAIPGSRRRDHDPAVPGVSIMRWSRPWRAAPTRPLGTRRVRANRRPDEAQKTGGDGTPRKSTATRAVLQCRGGSSTAPTTANGRGAPCVRVLELR